MIPIEITQKDIDRLQKCFNENKPFRISNISLGYGRCMPIKLVRKAEQKQQPICGWCGVDLATPYTGKVQFCREDCKNYYEKSK